MHVVLRSILFVACNLSVLVCSAKARVHVPYRDSKLTRLLQVPIRRVCVHSLTDALGAGFTRRQLLHSCGLHCLSFGTAGSQARVANTAAVQEMSFAETNSTLKFADRVKNVHTLAKVLLI